ncbi:MAG: TolC family protein [Proteobacteria bacterium]|nr:TolC family protein [Pseudomonadota bacterium]
MSFLLARRGTACTGIAVLIVAVARMSAANCAAPASEPVGTLTLADAIAVTLNRNPDLAVGAYELKAAEARTLQAGLRPNPEISLEAGGILGSGVARDVDEKQATLTLSQVLGLGDKRARRVEVAQSDHTLLGVDQQARALDVLAEVTRRYIEVVADQEQIISSRGALELAERTEKVIAARVKAARTPEAELSRARIATTRARIEVRQAQSTLEGARRSLAAMWGSTDARFAQAQADLYVLPPLESFDSLRRLLDRNPDFVRFASESRLREAEWRLARAQSRPNLTLTAGLRRFQSTGDVGLVAGFSLPLPLSDRNHGAIAEAQARRDQTQAGEHAARIRAQGQLYALYQQVQSGREQLAVLRQEALPQAQAALDQTQYGYDRGRFSYLELASAQQDLLALQITAIQVAADIHRLTAEIERLTGEPVAAASPSQDQP